MTPGKKKKGQDPKKLVLSRLVTPHPKLRTPHFTLHTSNAILIYLIVQCLPRNPQNT
jgi:hypothetical protein